jgi:hypothetical protein
MCIILLTICSYVIFLFHKNVTWWLKASIAGPKKSIARQWHLIVASNNESQDCGMGTTDSDLQHSNHNFWPMTNFSYLSSLYSIQNTTKNSSIVEWCVKRAIAYLWPRYCRCMSLFRLPWNCVDQPLPTKWTTLCARYSSFQLSCHIMF